MAKAKKPAARSAPRPIAKFVPSLPPEVLEQAAQGWLKSSGITASAAQPAELDQQFCGLTTSLAQALQGIRGELHDLRERIAHLEDKSG